MVTVKGFFIVITTGLLIASAGSVLTVKSDDLINNAREYDKKEVVYSGEVIGDIMQRGEYAWINVYDGSNSIGIWITYDEAKKIKYTGSYRYKGDIVEVTGIFNRACPEHGGDFDIHAKSMIVKKEGSEVKREINLIILYIAIAVFLIAAGLNLFIYKKRI
ncbi:MAG: hypothetical protein WA097_06670 [Candidatus Hydromicrobium sp.]